MILYAVLLCVAFWAWKTRRSVRSSLEKLPGPPAASFFAGNALELMDRHGWGFHERLMRTYGSVTKLHWLFGAPALYVYDPLALQHIVKDISTYEEPSWYIQSNSIMLGPGILSVEGDTHRRQRKMLTPVFSAKHLRSAVPVFYQVVDKLVDAISARVPAGPQAAEVDVLSWMGRAALELIGQSGIGYSFDPLTEDVPDAYTEAVKNYAPIATSPQVVMLRQMVPVLRHVGPVWLRRWVVQRFPLASVRRLAEISDTLHGRSLEIFRAKKAVIEAGGDADAMDIMSILVRANMNASEEDRLPENQLLGQMSSIIFAAMDTTSNSMARILHLLAEHPEVQAKLRREVLEAKAHGQMDYDQLHALPYLDAVCRETLRIAPAGVQTFRSASKDTVLPLSQPVRGTDGTLMSELTIPKGTNLFLAIWACNRTEDLWGPDAHEWKPERWLKPLPAAVESAAIPGVYSNLMTFLGGGRSCVGFTFSQLEMKVVISELIANFSFESSDTPVVWNLSGITYPSVSKESTKAEMWLRVRRL
ncbi:hypothetical protein VTO73DRAFT_15403 [Trametes versicolor]